MLIPLPVVRAFAVKRMPLPVVRLGALIERTFPVVGPCVFGELIMTEPVVSGLMLMLSPDED
jgi:hypothetical protein